MTIARTTRRRITAIAVYAVMLWTAIALGRTFPIRPHLLPVPNIPGMYNGYCPREPVWPKFAAMLLCRSWPGKYRCPDHPRSLIIEYPVSPGSQFWQWPRRTV